MNLRLGLICLFQLMEGRKFLSYYREYKENERISLEKLRAVQLGKLRRLVHHAYESVPYYRESFDSIGFRPDRLECIQDIKLLPFLEKNDLKLRFDDLISSKLKRNDLIEYATGGSTGIPTRFLLTKEQYDTRAAVSFKSYQATGWEFFTPTIFLSGAPIDQEKADELKSKLKDLMLRQWHVSSFDLTEERYKRIYDYIRKHKVYAIFGFVSSLLTFANYIERNKLSIEVPVIVQMAELVLPHEKMYIEKHLNGRFFKHYGARDAIAIGIECKQRSGLHANMDTLVVEILRNNEEAVGKNGEVVITDLYSFGMPLIRYKIGDVGTWLSRECNCGRHTPLFEITQGRKTNMLVNSDGVQMSGLFIAHLFKERSDRIIKYQVVQPNFNSILIKLVATDTFKITDQDYLEENLRKHLGRKIVINFEYLQEIPAELSGKFMSIKSDVSVSFGNIL